MLSIEKMNKNKLIYCLTMYLEMSIFVYIKGDIMTKAYKVTYQTSSNKCAEYTEVTYVDSVGLINGLVADWNGKASRGAMKSMGYKYWLTDAQKVSNANAELVEVPSMEFIHTSLNGGYLA
jgi:hypothetical protein